jgi:soluble lytic murein transglycosylase
MRAVRWCDDGGPADIRAKAKYQAGRANRYRHRFAVARAYFRRVEREHPHHSYADDACLRLAETWQMAKNKKAARKTYKRLVRQYPKGDMRAEAAWRLVREAYFAGQHTTALRLLAWSKKLAVREDIYYAAGRTSYWTGRIAQRLGRRKKALRAYLAAIKDHPLSYYALLAIERLKKLDPVQARKVNTQLRRGASRGASRGRSRGRSRGASRGRSRAGSGPRPGFPLELSGDRFFKKPAFERAVELGRLGLGRMALAELRAAGVDVFRGRASEAKKNKITAKQKKRLWAAAILLDRAGLYHLSHWTVRHLLDGFKKQYPGKANRWQWRLAYPTAFAPIVRSQGRRFGVPVELLWAIMREESAFNPRQISRARAVGLVQLLTSTARRFARGMGFEVNAQTLKRPEINVPIGARYLAYLLKSFGDRRPLAVAGYNAGENRIVRWVKKHRKLEVDAFVELIPFDQTRRYTKRVLASSYVYRFLDNPADPTPAVAFKLPRPHLGRIPPLPRPRPQASLAARPR